MAILYNKFRLSISDRVKNVSNLGSIKCQISAGCSLALLSFYLCNIIRTVFMTWQAFITLYSIWFRLNRCYCMQCNIQI